MKNFFATVTCLTWGLWFGGLISLFIFVTALFRWNHDMAVQTAPHLFAAFEPYQIGLAVVALVSAIAWRRSARRGLIVMIALFVLTAAGSIVSPVLLTSRMHALLVAGNTKSDEFKQLHGESMIVYTFDTGCLLIVGLMLPGAVRRA
jgi:hypothetical protein